MLLLLLFIYCLARKIPDTLALTVIDENFISETLERSAGYSIQLRTERRSDLVRSWVTFVVQMFRAIWIAAHLRMPPWPMET